MTNNTGRNLSKLLSVIFFVAYGLSAEAQNTLSPNTSGAAGTLPLPTILSPNATSMDMFRQVQVNMFTGTPDISIPIHTLKYGNITVPIGLRYNNASVKPAQQPGWVGLGWDLESFGIITRTVRGLNDDLYGDPGNNITEPLPSLNAYYPVNGNDAFFPLSSGGSGADLANVSNWDSQAQLLSDFTAVSAQTGAVNEIQADEFNFSFMGYSGTFYYSGRANQWQVVSDDNIQVTLNNPGFIASGDVLTAIGEFKQWLQPTEPQCNGCTAPNASSQTNVFSGFTLTVPNGTQYVFGGKEGIEFDSPYPWKDAGADEFQFFASAWLLTKIIDVNGNEVDFTYQRQFPTCNLSFGRSDFSYTARVPSFGSCPSGGLTTITDLISNFPHNGVYQWPMYLSSIKSPNETITFSVSDAVCLGYPLQLLQSRSGDGLTNADGIDVSLLNGLLTNFRWEQLDNIVITDNAGNTFRKYAFNYSSALSQRLTLNSFSENDNTNTVVKQYSFTYNNVLGLPQVMDGDETDAWGYANYFPEAGWPLANASAAKQPGGLASTGLLTQITYPTGGNTQFAWEANDYSQVVNTSRQSLSTPVSTPIRAGGARIQEITSFDVTGAILSDKKYYYKRGYNSTANPGMLISSGILNGTPLFGYNLNNRTNSSASPPATISTAVATINSVGVYSYNGQASFIGYDEVAEVREDGSYTRHFFTSYGADLNNVTHWDILPNAYLGWDPTADAYFPMSSLDLERGKPVGTFHYTPNNVLVQKTINTYRSDAARFNSFVKLIDFNTVLDCSAAQAVVFADARKKFSYDYFPVATIVTEYDNKGNNPVTSTEAYTYNANNLVTTKTTTNSKGESEVTTYKYPNDFFDAASTGMTAKHIISPVMQTSVVIGNIQQSLNYVNYYSPVTGHFSPQNVQEQIGTNPIETRQQFYQYDAFGNPQEESKTGDIHTVYLWSYNGQYPVAKITGSTLSAVLLVLQQTTLDAATAIPNNDINVRTLLQTLRTAPSLSNALVTTYTWSPVAGLTSETDPRGQTTFYQYDSFGRLHVVTDHDGNILKTYNYQYQN